MRKKANILVGVTGSIAAYKAADLVSKLNKAGHEIHVVMTAEATRFVTPLTFRTMSRHTVVLDLWEEESGEWKPTHLELADAADLLLIAPATAHIIAKLAHGLADDALSTIALATPAPILVAPAMNGKMWLHAATRANVKILRARGVRFLGPEQGMLACGYEGIGRLWNVDGILEAALKLLREKR
jgi:phosphopantothenoylcysteine decarboxylase/phosphopantothenoylcysteine decarboxylase/phosphopantothenate--cysteine ligase